jgi:hypothetical protein
MEKIASGIIKKATRACDAGCAQILPKAGKERRSTGAKPQWMAQRTEAATPIRSASGRLIRGVVAAFTVFMVLENNSQNEGSHE